MEEDNSVNKNELVKLKITHLIKFASSFVGVEVHLYVNGKYVKMNYANDQFIDILRKLQQKDLEEVYINQTDCQRVLNEVQASVASKSFFDPKTTDEQRVETLNHSHDVAKSIIGKFGVDKQTMDIMKSVNKKSLSLLSESATIYSFIKRFRQNCSQEFMISITTGYLTSLVIEKFPWKSNQVKEKAALASMLCDITLDKNDFAVLKAHYDNGEPLTEKVKNHPKEVVEILGKKKELVPTETITIIEQHHEIPDGTGFPQGIELNRFNQLSTIFIVCQRFTELLFVENFDYTKRQSIITHLQSIYTGRNFDKALGALIAVVDHE